MNASQSKFGLSFFVAHFKFVYHCLLTAVFGYICTHMRLKINSTQHIEFIVVMLPKKKMEFFKSQERHML